VFGSFWLKEERLESRYCFKLKLFHVIKKTPSPKKSEVSAAGYDARQAPINAKLGQDEKIQFYRDMVRIRRFEERCCAVTSRARSVASFTSTSARNRWRRLLPS